MRLSEVFRLFSFKRQIGKTVKLTSLINITLMSCEEKYVYYGLTCLNSLFKETMVVLNSHKMLIVIVADFDWSLWFEYFEYIYKRFVTLSENPVEVIFSTKKKIIIRMVRNVL